MNKKNIALITAFLLSLGLIIIIYLSLQVLNDTKTTKTTPAAIPNNIVETTSKPSIYGLELPDGKKEVIQVYGQPKVEEGKAFTPIPKKHIKTLEQEQVELSTGVQPEPASAPVIPETDIVSSSSASLGQTQNNEINSAAGQPQTNDLNPAKEDIRDLGKKGLVIF